jgi:putative ABC transport system permease protein
VRARLATIDREVALTDVRPATALVDASVAQPRFRMLLLALFGGIALALASIGVYGVMAYTIGQQRSELGIRMALGAGSRDVLRLVMHQGLFPVATGIVAGLAGAIALARLMSTLFFGIGPLDPMTFTAAPVVLGIVAAVACYIPARRATRVDPLTALRCD